MDGSRFDGIVKSLAAGTTRRRVVQGLAASPLAGLLAFVGREDAAAACVKAGKKGCDGPQNKKCCSGATCQGGSKDKEGRCECKGQLKECKGKCVNTKKDRKNCGGCNRKCAAGNSCKNGTCTSALGCRKGQSFCSEPPVTDPNDPRICQLEPVVCACFTSVNGRAFCSDVSVGDCSTCTKDADCPSGQLCINAVGGNCACDTEPGSNGNACVNASCGEVTGGATGDSALRSRLIRLP